MSSSLNPLLSVKKNENTGISGKVSHSPSKNNHNIFKNVSVDHNSMSGVNNHTKGKHSVYSSTQVDRGHPGSPREQARVSGAGRASPAMVKSVPPSNVAGSVFHNIYSIKSNTTRSQGKPASPETLETGLNAPLLNYSLGGDDARKKGRNTAFRTPFIAGGGGSPAPEPNSEALPLRRETKRKSKASTTSDEHKEAERHTPSVKKVQEAIPNEGRKGEEDKPDVMPPLLPPFLNPAHPPKGVQPTVATGAYRQGFTSRSPVDPAASLSTGGNSNNSNRVMIVAEKGDKGGRSDRGEKGEKGGHRSNAAAAATTLLPNLKKMSQDEASRHTSSPSCTPSVERKSNPGDLELSGSTMEQSWILCSPSNSSGSSSCDTEAGRDSTAVKSASESPQDLTFQAVEEEDILTVSTIDTATTTTTTTHTTSTSEKNSQVAPKSDPSRPLCQGFGFVWGDKSKARANAAPRASPSVQFIEEAPPRAEKVGTSFSRTLGGDTDESESSFVLAVGRGAPRNNLGRKRVDFGTPRVSEHFKDLDSVTIEKNVDTEAFASSDGGGAAAALRRNAGVLSAREKFFMPLPRLSDIIPTNATTKEIEQVLLHGAPCSWLTCIALAVSYVSGVPTTLEKVLRVNSIGMHCVCQPTVTLAEEYDQVSGYLHARFHRTSSSSLYTAPEEFDEDDEIGDWLNPEEQKLLPHLHCEMATFDSEVLDPIDEDDTSYGMGEHAPVISLANFRKTLVKYLSDGRSIYIFNFDPYIIEMEEKRLRNNMAETEEEAAAILADTRTKPNGEGTFGILLNFSVARNTVTLVVPHLTRDQHPMRKSSGENPEHVPGTKALGTCKSSGEDAVPHYCDLLSTEELEKRFSSVFSHVILEEHVINLNVLYEAVRKRDSYTQLSRGFVRVFFDQDFSPSVPSIFPLFVLDGSSSAGLMTSVLDASISPHLLGLALMHHLTITFLLSDTARRKQSSRCLLNRANVCDVKLRGIPLTKIVQQLRLPLSMIVGSSTKTSIATVFAWYRVFLQNLQISQEVRLGIVLPERRGGSEDGHPNITEEQFHSHLQLIVSTRSVMLISFNINIAVNLKLSDSPDPAHFAIVIGFDEQRGVIRLADVNVKRFRKTWHVPFHRLYNAIMGYGYVVAAKENKVIKALNCKQFKADVLKCGMHVLPPQLELGERRFEYPSRPYAVTLLADAVGRIGFHADVERFLNYSGYHISYFLSKRLPLEAAVQVLQNYSHYALDDALSVDASHFDYHKDNLPPGEADPWHPVNPKHKVWTEEDLLQQIQHALESPSTRRLIVNYNTFLLHSNQELWNGSHEGGFYAMVMNYDERQRLVALSDSNPSSFHRCFVLPLEYLFKLLCSHSAMSQRTYGTLLLSREHTREAVFDNTKGYDMAHALVHHPFRPIFSATCSCMALAATELMTNISVPTMLNGAPLALDDERKKYRRYNNIYSAEDFLYALPSFNLHTWLTNTTSVLSADLVPLANSAFKKLNLPLIVVDAIHDKPNALTDPGVFIEACSGINGLFTITIIAYDTDKMYGVPHGSLGLVNRVEVNEECPMETTVQMLEGNPCLWGPMCEKTVRELLPMVSAIVCVFEDPDDEKDCESSF